MTVSPTRPIFVVGAQRSGTTLLRYALCAHPRIYIPPESNFIPRFFKHHLDEPLTHREAVKAVSGIVGYAKFFKDWHGDDLPDPERFVDALPDRCPAAILDTLYSQYARQHGAVRWGDKSPIYTVHMDTIAAIFPSAQFVHIIRDGRDVALSMLKAYQGRRFFYMNLFYAGCTWKWRVQQARASGKRLGPDRYLEVRYEALTARPAAVLGEICSFLEEEYDPGMAEPHRSATSQHHSKGIYAATRQPINAGSVDNWRKKMSVTDQRIFQTVNGGLLEELGYETVDLGRMSMAEQIRLARLRSGYAAVESSRQLLQAMGVFHPAQLLSHRSRRKQPHPVNAH